MKIYVGHSREFNFYQDLYTPLRQSTLNTLFEIILPHETSEVPFNSREAMKSVDIMIAEVSHPSLGLGIEMGWADAAEIPIIGIHRAGAKVSNAVKPICAHYLEYINSKDLIEQLMTLLADID